MTRSHSALIAVTAACAALGYVTGFVAGFAWVFPLPAFGIALLGVLASLWVRPRHGRLAGVPVSGPVLVKEAA